MFKQVASFAKASLYYLIVLTLAVLVALFGQGLGERSALHLWVDDTPPG